jgi:CBS domain-containing protein
MKVYNTSTLERLMELRDRNGTVSRFSQELEQAFEFLLSLRLRHQFEQIQRGIEPDNHLDPSCLGTMERTQLKESFKLILSVQEATVKKYGSLMVM